MPKYGLISKTDARTLEKTIDLICDEFIECIYTCEIGVYSGLSSKGICEYIESKDKKHIHTGIDNFKDKEELKDFPINHIFIKGNSNEVYNRLQDNSQHMIIIDGNHSYPYVISDFYCYKNKVKKGGFICFHDYAPQAQGKDWQRIGSKTDPDMSIAVRKAVDDILELNSMDSNWEKQDCEYDESDSCGGFAIFKKIY